MHGAARFPLDHPGPAAPAAPPEVAGRERRLAALAALLLFAALALFGARWHRVEEAGTAERDGYVAQAEEILAGRLPRDPYRPLLYPLAVAGLSRSTGIAPFPAARLLANLSAAALAWLAWAMARRLGPRSGRGAGTAGGWAMALTAANPNLWRIGQHVTTDMPFAALAGAALLGGLLYMERPRAATAVAGGLAWGLAAFTRGNAVFLLPALVAAWWLGCRSAPARPLSARPPRHTLHLAAGVAAALAALLPHWALRAAAFGDPFHDENWKNLAWKLYGYPDWSYLARVPFSGPLELLKADPLRVVRGAVAELGRFLAEGLPQLGGTWFHVALLAAGAAVALRRPASRRAAAWLLGAGALLVGATALVFFAWGRLLLVLLPAGNALAALATVAAVPLGLPAAAGRRRRRLLAAAGAAAVGLLALKTFAFRMPAFVANHPCAEIAALRRLDARLPRGVPVAGTSPFLGRYLKRPYITIPDAFGRETAEPALYFERLRALLERAGAGSVVAGEIDLRDRPRSLLGPSPPVPWLAPEAPARGPSGRRVAVWRVTPGRPLEGTAGR
jgi:4-amino-4-deoxy-L-arabinose transferase-like glycosyltransferase